MSKPVHYTQKYIANKHQFITVGSNDILIPNIVSQPNVTAMTILPSGNVGIGTTVPQQPLHIQGNAYVSGNISAGNMGMFRNRIINGDMRIDQRNNGNAVTNASGNLIDRFILNKNGTLQQTVQQVSLPSPLLGYRKCLKITVGTQQASLGVADYSNCFQRIEGYNVADLMLGTAFAQPFTFSFWIQSTNTGTYSIYFTNGGFVRSYVTNFTITTANVWQYITVTVPGDTSGTWNSDNSIGLEVGLCFGTGTTYQTTPNIWQGSGYIGTSSTNNFFANSVGSIIYTMGWQLEKGTIATPFEFRPFPVELQLCQRYYEILAGWYQTSALPSGQANEYTIGHTSQFKVTKRATPNMLTINMRTGFNSVAFRQVNTQGFFYGPTQSATFSNGYIYVDGFTAESEF